MKNEKKMQLKKWREKFHIINKILLEKKAKKETASQLSLTQPYTLTQHSITQKMTSKPNKFATGTVTQEVVGDSVHTYSLEEQQSLVDYLNNALKNDPELTTPGRFPHAHIPIDRDSDDIFDALKDGIILR